MESLPLSFYPSIPKERIEAAFPFEFLFKRISTRFGNLHASSNQNDKNYRRNFDNRNRFGILFDWN